MKPDRNQLEAAAGRRIPDLVAPNLRVLFCGINPGLYSAALGQHFARPGNRFWKVLAGAGFTDRVLAAAEQGELLTVGVGITNLVARATAAAAELSRAELVAGGRRLRTTAIRLRPAHVAVVGMGAYRTAFARPRASVGRQPEPLGPATLWMLPNPSGLQAHYQLPELVDAFAELRRAAFGPEPATGTPG